MARAGRSPAWCSSGTSSSSPALLGAANAIETPVRQAFVSELVGTPLLPNALSLSSADVQHRPDRRAGRRRAGHRAARRTGPIFLITAVASLAPAGQRWPGCAPPSCTASTCRRSRRATPGSSTDCAMCGTAPTCCSPILLDARGRPVRLQLPAHPRGAGEDRVPHRRPVLRPAHHRARRRRARRRAGQLAPPRAAHGLCGARGRRALRRIRDARRLRARRSSRRWCCSCRPGSS